MQLHPYLNFNGTCEEAFKFYEQVLRGKIVMMMTHGGSPMAGQAPAGWTDKILHARLEAGDAVLLASDSPPQHFEAAKGIYVSLNLTDPADADRIFAALATGVRCRCRSSRRSGRHGSACSWIASAPRG